MNLAAEVPKACYEVHLPVAWNRLADVRSMTERLLANASEDTRDAAMMAATELAENVLKYGEAYDGDETGSVQVSVDGRRVRVQSRSGLLAEARAARVLERIAEIAGGDAMALYVARLEALAENPYDKDSGLGFYRIAFEGGFELRASYAHPVLTIVAERDVR